MLKTSPSGADEIVKVGDLALNKVAFKVHRQRREVHLGPTEYRLLVTLIEAPGRVFSRRELHHALWGDASDVDERTVDLHIARLRKQINLGKEDEMIRTVRGQGYVLGDF
ncbi:MAG: phoB [Rhizobium sp.]|nr:phoB [Rhizobium sp.]